MKQTRILTAVLLALTSAAVFAQAPKIDEQRVNALIAEQNIPVEQLSAEQLETVRKQALLQLQRAEVLKNEALAAGLDKEPKVQWQKQNMEAGFYAGEYLRHLQETVTIDEADVRKLYEQMTREIKLQQAVFSNKEAALAAITQLRNGKSFGDMIASLDNQPAPLADFINPQDLPPEMGAVVSQLSKGEMTSEPFEYQGVFYLLKVQDSRIGENLPPYEQLREQLTQHQKELQVRKMVEDLFHKQGLE